MMWTKKLLFHIGNNLPYFFFHNNLVHYICMLLYSGRIAKTCHIIDNYNFTIETTSQIVGGACVSIGSGHIRSFCRISAITQYNGEVFYPTIIIGKNVNIGINNHIGAIGKIIIGDNFLSGANCLITDHCHGGGGGVYDTTR